MVSRTAYYNLEIIMDIYTQMSFAHVLAKTFLLVLLVMNLESIRIATSDCLCVRVHLSFVCFHLPPRGYLYRKLHDLIAVCLGETL